MSEPAFDHQPPPHRLPHPTPAGSAPPDDLVVRRLVFGGTIQTTVYDAEENPLSTSPPRPFVEREERVIDSEGRLRSVGWTRVGEG